MYHQWKKIVVDGETFWVIPESEMTKSITSLKKLEGVSIQNATWEDRKPYLEKRTQNGTQLDHTAYEDTEGGGTLSGTQRAKSVDNLWITFKKMRIWRILFFSFIRKE